MGVAMRNVVFDFGAVLFTWQPGVLIKTHFPEHAHAPEATAALAHAVFGHADWHAFDRGVLAASEVSERTARRLGLHEPSLATLIEQIADHLQPIHESVALLRSLRDLKAHGRTDINLYFLSNMPLPYARVLERKHDWMQWFDGGVFSGDVKLIKPEPAIYQLLQDRHALDPAQTVFIDDLLANVKAAQALGWHGIHFESAAQVGRALAGHFGAELLGVTPSV